MIFSPKAKITRKYDDKHPIRRIVIVDKEHMKKTILTFGLISGVFSSLMMVATVPFEDKIGFERAEVVGYTLIVLSFLLVFFGIRSYRDNVGRGQITFGKGFIVGISITLITCLCYVLTWEILYFTVLHDFMDKYGAYLVAKLKASGATAGRPPGQTGGTKKIQRDV